MSAKKTKVVCPT